MKKNKELYESIMRDVRKEFLKRLQEDFLDDMSARKQSSSQRTYQESFRAQVEDAVNDIFMSRQPVFDPQGYIAIYKPESDLMFNQLVFYSVGVLGDKCDLNWIDTSEITDMSGAFLGSKFTGDISKWDTSKVTAMTEMFRNSDFDGDISGWDVSNCMDFTEMFKYSEFSGNNGNLKKWKIKRNAHISRMFQYSRTTDDKIPLSILKRRTKGDSR